MSDVIIWSTPPKLTRNALAKQLKRALRTRVKQAFLIGSHANGSATDMSDIDLILVHDTARPWPERGKDFMDLYDRFGALDLIIYTPDEWQTMRRTPSAFVTHALQSAIRVA